MTCGGDVEKGEASRKRLGLPVKSERAKKKARPTKYVSKLPRKRAWSEVTETEYLNDDQDSSKWNSTSHMPSQKILRVSSTKKLSGEGIKLVENRGSKGSEPNTRESVSPLRETGVAQEPELPQRKFKRIPKAANLGGSESTSEPSGSSLKGVSGDRLDTNEEYLGTESAAEEEKVGKQMPSRENEVVRQVLQTVHLEETRVGGSKHSIAEHEESSVDLENESADTVSSLEQTALIGRGRKRREADSAEGSPPIRPEKKLRIDVEGAEGSHRSGDHGVTLAHTNTWKRHKRRNKETSAAAAAAAAEDMAVSISEAWKRLREWKDTETSGSSVNVDSDSDLSMRSCPSLAERIEERSSKKARYESPLPSVGRKWKRYSREKKRSSSSKRLREGNGCESSGSAGSDMAQSSYLHNRKWKRPRHENLMAVQRRSGRRESRDGEEARKRSRKRGSG